MTNLKGLILDFGGVLTTPLAPAALAFEKRAGLPEGALINALYLDEEMVRHTEELERGALTQAQWNAEAAARLGIQAENLMGRIFADLRPETTVIAAAAAARRAGVKVGILSNSVGRTPWDLYAGYDLDYDAVVISEECRMRKPEREIFQLALDRLGLPAELCVFVDDTQRYLPPAAALGLTAVHATDPGRTVAELERIFGMELTVSA